MCLTLITRSAAAAASACSRRNMASDADSSSACRRASELTMAKTKTLEKNQLDRVIGGRIRRRRITLNMTQAALAGCLGVSFQQVQRYEKGVARIGKDRL